MLTDSDQIWNRACLNEPLSLRKGDRALAALLIFHGAAMNGGVPHAIACLEQERLDAAISGYRLFGFDNIADLLTDAVNVAAAGASLEFLEIRLNGLYNKFVPDDATLRDRFNAYLSCNPLEFSPL